MKTLKTKVSKIHTTKRIGLWFKSHLNLTIAISLVFLVFVYVMISATNMLPIIRAINLTNSRQFKEAITIFDEYIQLDKADIFFYRGNAYQGLKEYETALQDYDRAIEREASLWEYFKERSYVLEQLGKYELAIDDYQTILKIVPQSQYLNAHIARNYVSLNDPENALKYYDLAIKAQSDKTYLYRERARIFLEWEYSKERSYVLEQLGKYELTIDDYQTTLKFVRQSWNINAHIARNYVSLNDPENALKYYDLAIKAQSDKPYLYRQRARIFLETEQYDLSLMDLNQAIGLQPNNSSNYVLRAQNYAAQGLTEQAIEEMNMALTLNTRNPRIYANRAELYVTVGDFQLAINDYLKAIEIRLIQPNFYKALAATYDSINEYAYALDYYQQYVVTMASDAISPIITQRIQELELLIQS